MTEFVCDTCGWKKERSLKTIFTDMDITVCDTCDEDTVESSESDFITNDEYVIISLDYK